MQGRNFFRKRRGDLHDLQDLAREKLGHLQESAREYFQEGRQKTREWTEAVESFVHSRPLSSLAIAAGIGICIGIALTTRGRRETERWRLRHELAEAERG